MLISKMHQQQHQSEDNHAAAAVAAVPVERGSAGLRKDHHPSTPKVYDFTYLSVCCFKSFEHCCIYVSCCRYVLPAAHKAKIE